ncbi:hypothetical protein QTI66_36140 [Variovorax sp. J22R133]|uniref:hypothetical protein n=1 Tax=Variovorax brevis TaxID=3053503 RepID=UPI002575369A|nr:hypothetical protein [Variovorax sp. J22R133]MDM0117545.1 hypothetical protein [Variovorax sp. J22R133]
MSAMKSEPNRAATSFARMEEALQYAASALKAGRCVTVWPVDAAGYRLQAWDFEEQVDDELYAPTAPLELEIPANRRGSS